MTLRRRLVWRGALAALVIISVAEARTVAVKEAARLRTEPSATAALLREIAPGTMLEVLGENGGWRRVQTSDGQTGYVWAAHLAETGTDPGPADTPRPEVPTSGGGRSLVDEVHALRDDIGALRERPGPATAVDLERLRSEVEHLAAAEEGLARRLDERALPIVPVDPAPESAQGLTALLVLLGVVFGWVASRLFQGRRDHRQRNRLRL